MTALRAAAAAALLAAAPAGAGEPHAQPPPAAAARPSAPARADGKAPAAAEVARPAADRPRVTPGVLVRAAKRAQQREAAACGPCAAQGAAQSIEIEWRAAPATP